jgi:hypothetical protein
MYTQPALMTADRVPGVGGSRKNDGDTGTIESRRTNVRASLAADGGRSS